MMSKEHSFVVLAYKDSPFLEGCMECLAAQTVKTQTILATSTPSPFIDAVAARFNVGVRVNPRADGIGADWNFGLSATSANFVTLVHQDDTYAPRFVERTLELFEKHPEAALCFTSYAEIDDHGKQKTSKISIVKHALEKSILGSREKVRGTRLRAFLAFGCPLPCSAVTFNRARLSDFLFSLNYKANLDWDAWLRLQERGETFLHASERLIGRRHNPMTETSRLIRAGVRQKEDLEMFKRIWPTPLSDTIAYLYRAGY
jgi:hypothetical protein